MRYSALYCGGFLEEEEQKEEFAKQYTKFAETAAFPPIITERTNFMTGKFVLHWAHSQISIKSLSHSYGHECGYYTRLN